MEDLEGFWGAIWERCEVEGLLQPYERVLGREDMPGAVWFPGARLNYAQHLLAMGRPGLRRSHASEAQRAGGAVLARAPRPVARCAAGPRRLGVGRGDRVAAYMPNVPETVVAFLASASIGAIWSSCAPEFGAPTVIDRFAQIEPKVLIATEGYRYGGRDFDRRRACARSRRRSRRSSTP